MAEEQITHEITLVGGYTDPRKTVHRRVVFGKRPTAADLMRIDIAPEAQIPTQYMDCLIIDSIVEFGTLPIPASLKVLLDLDSIDRDDLVVGYNEFQALSLGDRKSSISEKGATLLFGFKSGDLEYPVVEFGRRITGRDQVEADKLGYEASKAGIARMCYLTGRQISKLKTANGSSAIEGPIDLEMFEALDGADVQVLRGAAELWRQSFRLKGGAVSASGTKAASGAAGAEVQLDRGADPGDAGRPA